METMARSFPCTRNSGCIVILRSKNMTLNVCDDVRHRFCQHTHTSADAVTIFENADKSMVDGISDCSEDSLMLTTEYERYTHISLTTLAD